ncbi:AbiH family protein [Bifidobacterium sp. ESL0775]|uniref:AbiH family protein n=1 Tax=Bifidobacterium sp. ESL0775 TaxID=2983230 RepID=UPI0023F7B059|nr:AbiH family protein [Bifidobacterium sp. ESL0775]WEV69590.1 AbiH family protein [Bifidobacterium sp. ESL0775]
MTAQLLVLGNGFDIACGLHSKYGEFFHDRYSKHHSQPKCCLDDDKSLAKTVLESISMGGSGLFSHLEGSSTVWDIAFLANCSNADNLKTWCDVETFIKTELDWWKDWLIQIGDKFTDLDSLANQLRNLSFPVSDCHKDEKLAFIKGFQEYVQQNHPLAAHTCRTEYDVFSFLKKELETFEQDFGEYIVKCAPLKNQRELYHGGEDYNDAEVRYFHRCDSLFKEIKTAGNVNPDNIDNLVASFNFTVPFYQSERRFQYVQNIHGTPQKPIFGISSFERIKDKDSWKICKITDNRRIFAKEFREAEQGRDQSLTNILAHNTFKYVKVFGHSLGEIDDQAFFEILDSINLYHGNTTLMFLYTKGANVKSLKTAISLLIKRYDDYLRKQGKTIHFIDKLKLRCKRRILVKQVDTPKESKSVLPYQIVSPYGNQEPSFGAPPKPTSKIIFKL